MSKARIVDGTLRTDGHGMRSALLNAIEGRIEEVCRDLAVQTKRMGQLQVQAEELRTSVRDFVAMADRGPSPVPATRAGRR